MLCCRFQRSEHLAGGVAANLGELPFVTSERADFHVFKHKLFQKMKWHRQTKYRTYFSHVANPGGLEASDRLETHQFCEENNCEFLNMGPATLVRCACPDASLLNCFIY